MGPRKASALVGPAVLLRLRAAAVLVLLATGATACRPDTVRIAFRPATGARYHYKVEARSVTTTTLPDSLPVRTSEETALRARHTVLSAGPAGTRVEIRLRDGSGPTPSTRTLVVRLDRSAQLTEVQRVEGLPASALGALGLSEIFPAAAGTVPDRPLRPGGTWEIDEPVRLPGLASSRLQGRGRLAELGIVRGREVARVQTSLRLPVVHRSNEAGEEITLRGIQRTTATTTHALADGAVEVATATTRAVFAMELRRPDAGASPVTGRLEVNVQSTTTRVAPD